MARTESTIDVDVPPWMASDTEESVVGTEWHQEAIGSLATMLRIVARRWDMSWGICEQIQVIGLHKPGGEPYDPRPDVMVLAQPFDGRRSSIPFGEAGIPLFISEVVSESSVAQDVGDKQYVYAQVGVPEYIAFDPLAAWLSGSVRAWRLESPGARSYVPWVPEPDGWWHSSALGVSFQVAQPFLRVRDRDNRIIQAPVDMAHQVEVMERQLREAQQRVRDLEEQLRHRQQEES